MGKAKRQLKAEMRATKSPSNSTSTAPFNFLSQLSQNRSWLILSIFILAFGIRMVYLAEDASSPFFSVQGTDAKIYNIRAHGLLNGSWPGHAAFELRPPGYPFFLASIYTIFGDSPTAAKFIQMVLGALSCILIFLIAEQLFGGVRVASLAAVLYAFNGVIIFYDSHLLSGSLDVFLTLAVLLLFLKASRHQHILIQLIAGIVIGFSIINRGWMLLFLPFGILWLWLSTNKQKICDDPSHATSLAQYLKPSSQSIRQCLVITGAALLPLIMIVWQNAKYNEPLSKQNQAELNFTQTAKNIVHGQFVMLAAGNINFYIGNHKDWRTFNDASIDDAGHFIDFQRLREEPERLHNITSVSGKNTYFTQKTLQTIREDPLTWIQLMARKTFQYFHGNEIPRAVTIYAHRQYSYLLSALVWKNGIAFPSGIIIPLGLVGLFLARRSWQQHFPAMALLAIHIGFLLLFFITARYRLPAIPILTIYAAFSITTLIDLFKNKQYKIFAIISAAIISIGIISNFNVGSMPEHSPHEYNSLGVALYKQNKIQASIDAYQKALSVNSQHAESHRNLGLSYSKLGRTEDALYHGKKAIEFDPGYVDAFSDLANIYLLQNRIGDAIEHFKRAIELAPQNSEAYLNLAVAYYKIKEYALAAQNAQQAVELVPSDAQARYNFARILLSMGNEKEAIFQLSETLKLDPSNQRAQALMQQLSQSP